MRRHDHADVQYLGELRGLAEIRIADDVPSRPKKVAAVDRDEGQVYVPGREGFDHTVVHDGVTGMIDGHTVPLDDVTEIRIAALGVVLQLRMGRRYGRYRGPGDL